MFLFFFSLFFIAYVLVFVYFYISVFAERGIEEAIFSQVLQEHSKLCNVYAIVPPTPSALAMVHMHARVGV